MNVEAEVNPCPLAEDYSEHSAHDLSSKTVQKPSDSLAFGVKDRWSDISGTIWSTEREYDISHSSLG